MKHCLKSYVLFGLIALFGACSDDTQEDKKPVVPADMNNVDMSDMQDMSDMNDMSDMQDMLATPCKEDEYVRMGTCTPCAPGTTNPAGDQPNGADTACTATQCTENQFVLDNVCTDCLPGTTRAAGDDTSGANTTCEKTLCEEDQYVLDNVCTACPDDTTNEAGDDASAENTQCDDACTLVFGVSCDRALHYVKASNTESGDSFGYSVALDGNTLVVGAISESSNGMQMDNSIANGGAVYVFVKDSNGVWSQQAFLKASNVGENDLFGHAVSVSGDTIVVGATGESSDATGIGGDQMNDAAQNSGAVYVFVRNNDTWTQQAYLKASNAEANDAFGQAVAVDQDTLVVSARSESSNSINDPSNNALAQSGAVYVFVRNNDTWTQQAYLKASNPGANDRFGYDVDISNDTIVVGAIGEGSNATGIGGDQMNDAARDSGAAYVFVRSNNAWTQQAYIKASNADVTDLFGYAVGVSGDSIVVSAPQESSTAVGVNGDETLNGFATSGAAYVFVRNNGTWTQQAYLKASNTGRNHFFGYSAAISGDRVVIGSTGDAADGKGVNGVQNNSNAPGAGSAYLFARENNMWRQQAYLKPTNTGGSFRFGWALDISANDVVVAATGEGSNATGVNGNQQDNTAQNSGAVYLYLR